MKKIKKLFGNIDLTWKKLIIFAIIAGVYTAIMAIIPIAKDTSFSDLVATFEVWILFGIFIIMNSKSPKESALKCFVFFLISQPLIYLIQVPFSQLGWQLFKYYPYWFAYTVATLPMGFIGWYMKKDKWWGLLILAPILILLGVHFGQYLNITMFSFPKHILTTLFCAITILLYPMIIFNNKKTKIIGVSIAIIILIIFGFLTLNKPQTYETEILTNGGSQEVYFDDSYKVYLIDESIGTVDIRFVEQGLNDWVVHANFKKEGNTEIILEAPNGEKTVLDIEVKRRTYTIKKQVIEKKQEENIDMIMLKVNNRELEVKLEDNETTKELVEKLKNGDIKVNANEYGGFEKVGNLGFNLPKNDTHITTSAGDIVLYQGNQISLFYNSNSWNYTRIGKIQNISESELKKILGTENADMIFSLKK